MRYLASFLRLGIVAPPPPPQPNINPMVPGMTADAAADFGYFATLSNLNAYAEGYAPVSGDTTTTCTLTAQNVLAKNIVITTGSITGGFLIQLPSTVSIYQLLGPTIPLDGSFYFPLYISNQGTGQTGTLTAGDSDTVVSATENTLATNVSGKWIVQVIQIAGAKQLYLYRIFAGDA